MMPDRLTAARRFSVAPMMDWTDRHARFFLRLLSRRATLFTEMVTTGAVIHGDRPYLLGFSDAEHPLVLQVGGSDPYDMAEAARIGADWGYDEININVGCPSDRVQSGAFGACLMARPEDVAACVAAMTQAVSIPVSIKCRIGIDNQDPHVSLFDLVRHAGDAGCTRFYVHARKAWLTGLSPKENRHIPPLMYDVVYQLKQAMPDLFIAINGGIVSLDQAVTHLVHTDGVMLGRVAYRTPYVLAEVDQQIYGDSVPVRTRGDILESFYPYVDQMLSQGWRLNSITRHIIGLYHGQPGARRWRQHLSSHAHKPNGDVSVIQDAVRAMTG